MIPNAGSSTTLFLGLLRVTIGGLDAVFLCVFRLWMGFGGGLFGVMPIRRSAWLGVEKLGMEHELLKLPLYRRCSFRYFGLFAWS